MKYTNIYNIISKVYRDTALDVDEADLIEWAGEALEATESVGQYEEAVAFIEVINHQCLLPAGLTQIIQIAKNDCFTNEASTDLCAATVAAAAVTEDGEKFPVPIDCNGTPLAEFELAYYRPYFDLIYEYEGWTGRNNYYRSCYSPVRLADNSFFNSIVCTETNPDIKHLYKTSQYEYSIVDPYLRFSFKEGSIAIAYRRHKVDDNGFPMIPDHYSYREAVVRYVRYKIACKKYDMAQTAQAERYMQNADRDWHWYCKQAGNKGFGPQGVDDFQDLLDQKTYLLPRQHRYYGFFGRLNQPEARIWNRTGTYLGYRGYPMSSDFAPII